MTIMMKFASLLFVIGIAGAMDDGGGGCCLVGGGCSGGSGGGDGGGGGHGNRSYGRDYPADWDEEDEAEKEEEELAASFLRRCKTCGLLGYLRKQVCANPLCDDWYGALPGLGWWNMRGGKDARTLPAAPGNMFPPLPPQVAPVQPAHPPPPPPPSQLVPTPPAFPPPPLPPAAQLSFVPMTPPNAGPPAAPRAPLGAVGRVWQLSEYRQLAVSKVDSRYQERRTGKKNKGVKRAAWWEASLPNSLEPQLLNAIS